MRMPEQLFLAALSAFGLACGSRAPISLPAPIAGQLAAEYRLEETRAVVLARVTVYTDGEPGFGPITNPLLLQFQPAGEKTDPPSVTLPNTDSRVWVAASQRPSVWRYAAPGLLAMSMTPGSYDALAIAYPDHSQETATPDSIPRPSRGLVFAPIEVAAGEVAYLGDIEIRQHAGFWDLAADRVDVAFTVRDDADRTIADFLALYPQLRDAVVERDLIHPQP